MTHCIDLLRLVNTYLPTHLHGWVCFFEVHRQNNNGWHSDNCSGYTLGCIGDLVLLVKTVLSKWLIVEYLSWVDELVWSDCYESSYEIFFRYLYPYMHIIMLDVSGNLTQKKLEEVYITEKTKISSENGKSTSEVWYSVVKIIFRVCLFLLQY